MFSAIRRRAIAWYNAPFVSRETVRKAMPQVAVSDDEILRCPEERLRAERRFANTTKHAMQLVGYMGLGTGLSRVSPDWPLLLKFGVALPYSAGFALCGLYIGRFVYESQADPIERRGKFILINIFTVAGILAYHEFILHAKSKKE